MIISQSIISVNRRRYEQWTIYVNETDSPRRKRFTTAHELGHYISYQCNSHSKEYIDNNNGVTEDYAIMGRAKTQDNADPREIEANQIAAQILMPKSEVEDLI